MACNFDGHTKSAPGVPGSTLEGTPGKQTSPSPAVQLSAGFVFFFRDTITLLKRYITLWGDKKAPKGKSNPSADDGREK